MKDSVERAIEAIKNSKRTTVFSGAGISVESGIPPFRGENGLWNKFNPEILDINYFFQHPEKSWKAIKEIFYDFFGKAKANDAHILLGELEKKGLIHSIITQNIDGLHQEGGSKEVYEFHGSSRELICTGCGKKYKAEDINLDVLPPLCDDCGALLKPDFVFFGEPIPEPARTQSFAETDLADVFLVIGTTGEIMPASLIPFEASRKGKTIIEINVEPSNFTRQITGIFLQGKATEMMRRIYDGILTK